MRIFFFTNTDNKCAGQCHWQRCGERYLHLLRRHDELGEITDLGRRSTGATPCCGDLVILYADDQEALDRLVGGRERFEGMRKILVLGETESGDDRKYHLLEPRYITQAERSLSELAAVIGKMKLVGGAPPPQLQGVGR